MIKEAITRVLGVPSLRKARRSSARAITIRELIILMKRVQLRFLQLRSLFFFFNREVDPFACPHEASMSFGFSSFF